MKFSLSLFALLIFNTFNSQTQQQVYSGTYENGKATYQYYENENLDRIYNGSFNYISTIYTVKGQFSENQRDGVWKFYATKKYFKNELGRLYINGIVSGNYDKGNMSGDWIFDNSIKTYNSKTRKYNYTPENTKAKASFANNYFTGNITYEIGMKDKTTISGQFSDKGLATGVWTRKSKLEFEELNFENGIMTSRIVKNLATGDKLIDENYSALIRSFWKNYSKKDKSAIIDGKMYIIDTIDFVNPAVDLWRKDLIFVESYGNILNPIYTSKRGQTSPFAYEVKIMECQSNSDCYSDYVKRKNAEQERLTQIQNEETKRLREEKLAQEEELRIQQEKELERQRIIKVLNAEKITQQLLEQKKYRSAFNQLIELNKLQPSKKTEDEIALCSKILAKIDSSLALRAQILGNLKERSPQSFIDAYQFEQNVTAKKKVYARNYIMCLDYLKNDFKPKLDSYLESQIPKNSDFENWSEENQQDLNEIKDLAHKFEVIEKFVSEVKNAVTTNNKTKLRILNSSINPQNIINDMTK